MQEQPNTLEAQVARAVEALQQMLREDGSQVALVSLDGAHATLSVQGALCHCTSSELELHQEIKGFLRSSVPGLASITVKTAR